MADVTVVLAGISDPTPCVPEIPTRAQRYMRRLGTFTGIPYGYRPPSKRWRSGYNRLCTRGNVQWFKDADQTNGGTLRLPRETRRRSGRCVRSSFTMSPWSTVPTNSAGVLQVALMWKRLLHPNVVPLQDATIQPLQLVSLPITHCRQIQPPPS